MTSRDSYAAHGTDPERTTVDQVFQFRASALSAFHGRFCSRCDIAIPHLPRFRVPEAENALDTNPDTISDGFFDTKNN